MVNLRRFLPGGVPFRRWECIFQRVYLAYTPQEGTRDKAYPPTSEGTWDQAYSPQKDPGTKHAYPRPTKMDLGPGIPHPPQKAPGTRHSHPEKDPGTRHTYPKKAPRTRHTRPSMKGHTLTKTLEVSLFIVDTFVKFDENLPLHTK